MSKFDQAGFLKFVLVFVSRELELGGVPAVSPSRKKFFRFQLHRGRRVMHDGMPYDSIQHQGQGHGASEVPKIALFKLYLLRHLQWELANDH